MGSDLQDAPAIVTKLVRGKPSGKAVRSKLRGAQKSITEEDVPGAYGRCVRVASLKFSNALRSWTEVRNYSSILSTIRHSRLSPELTWSYFHSSAKFTSAGPGHANSVLIAWLGRSIR